MALGEPVVTVFLAIAAFVHLTCTTAISIRLVTICAIITEALVMRTILPAYWAYSCVTLFAVSIA